VSGVQVHPVRTRGDFREFVQLPYRLHARDRNWVPPFRRGMFRALDRRTSPFYQEAQIEEFVARDSRGVCVGRIAAVIQPAYVERHGPKAFFGFFESQNDEQVARALLACVEGWAAERGFKTVVGPYSHQDSGVLIDGFETPPALLQAYNPRYYPLLLASCGYTPIFEMSAYTLTAEEIRPRVAETIARGEEVAAHNDLTTRGMDLSQYDDEVEMLRRLYNESFAMHPESVPISRLVFQALAEDLRPVLDPSLVRIIEARRKPVGFCVMVPNINEFLIGRSGRLTPFLLLRWKALMAKVRSVVVVWIGVDPALVGKGIGRCLAAEISRAIASGRYHTAHTTWIHENNRASRALFGHLKRPPAKRYAVFEKIIS